MWASYLPSLLLIVPLVAGMDLRARQNSSITIASRVAKGIQTEGKTCPYELCTNIAAYFYETNLTLTCWTYGSNVVDSNVWLKTTDGAYVTQWDIIDYPGDFTDTQGFPYCGYIPETITTAPSSTVYYTECNIIPDFVQREDHIKMYKPDVDLTLTCYASDGDDVLGDLVWYKTTSNCYVPKAQIDDFDDALDNCGPIPFMETKMRDPDPVPTPAVSIAIWSEDGHDSTLKPRDEQSPRITEKRWLYLTQIASVFSNCFSDPISNSKVERVYSKGDYIVVQCATYGISPEEEQIYLLTENFCWVNDTLTDPQLVDDGLRADRYPNCNYFVDA